MNDSKKWYESKAIWGSVIMVLATVAGLFGYEISEDLKTNAIEVIMSIVGILGGVLAFVGRIKATKKISK